MKKRDQKRRAAKVVVDDKALRMLPTDELQGVVGGEGCACPKVPPH